MPTTQEFNASDPKRNVAKVVLLAAIDPSGQPRILECQSDGTLKTTGSGGGGGSSTTNLNILRTNVQVEITNDNGTGAIIPVVNSTQAGVMSAQMLALLNSSPKAYVHSQSVSAQNWVVNHNLGYYPIVSLYSVSLKEFEGDVLHVSLNQFTVSLTGSFAGFARAV